MPIFTELNLYLTIQINDMPLLGKHMNKILKKPIYTTEISISKSNI
jgi:hypothetical protein